MGFSKIYAAFRTMGTPTRTKQQDKVELLILCGVYCLIANDTIGHLTS